MSKFISLYDYLKRAAGSELGKQVANYAATQKVPHKTRFVSNASYTGEVMLYPPEFLDEYFNKKIDIVEINTQLMEDSFRMAEEENKDRIF
jgi:hypothetical protein